MAFTTTAFASWLGGIAPAGFTTKTGPYVPDKVNKLILVTQVPGAGDTHEGVFYRPAFQIRLRTGPNDQEGAELAIEQLALAIRRAPSQQIGGHWVTAFQVINGPQALPETPDSGRRYEQVMTVLLTVSTNI